MYVRDAKNRDEVWLLDNIEEMGLDDASFRSRDYVIAVDEDTHERAGFGRTRVHKTEDGNYCELTGIGVVEEWRGQGIGAHVVERLIEKAGDDDFDRVYSITDQPRYLMQFGFEPIESSDLPERLQERLEQKREEVSEDCVAMALPTGQFEMPDGLRQAFKQADSHHEQSDETTPEESAEDFGIDPDNATYKYDTGS